MEQRNTIVRVPRLGPVERLACLLMRPFMLIVSGTFREEPKSGIGPLNYVRLPRYESDTLDPDMMVFCEGTKNRVDSGIRCHMPIFGGWRNYTVLERADSDVGAWYVGFRHPDDLLAEVCREKNTLPTRMLVGTRTVAFFGIDNETRRQIPIRLVGSGRIGDGNVYSRSPLR